MSTLLLTAAQCESLLRHEDLIPALREAHLELARGAAVQPAPSPLRAGPSPDADAWVPMAAYSASLELVAVKLLMDRPSERSHGRAAQRSTVALYDARTGACVLLADGAAVTRMRTASATAVATAALAPSGARVLGLVGAGALAVEHVAAHREIMEIDEIVVWSRSSTSRMGFADRVGAVAASSVAEVFEAADVVCTLTPSSEPIVTAGMLRPGTHLNAVGSPPRPTFRELEPKVLARADRVVVDALPVALAESGNVVSAVADAVIEPGDLVELGSVLADHHRGRRNPAEITVFNSVGLGLQDLAALSVLRQRALDLGVGLQTDLRDNR